MPPAASQPSPAYYDAAELAALAERGVVVPAPHLVAVAREVPLDAIAPGAVLHPFCRLSGPATRIDAGAVIGAAGPATVRDSRIGAGAVVGSLGPVTLDGVTAGAGTVLGCGVAEQAVFLGREGDDPAHTTGYGFRVRKGSLYEEDANSAQHTDTKMTILLPWVTLGSNVNWCDVLVAGGTGPQPGRFSEIGSGAIHFNFTPRGDKATGSLLGNVTEGVFLRGKRLFVGGNASIVGPLRGEFGAVTGAGGRFQGQLHSGLNPPQAPREEKRNDGFQLEAYGSVKRVVDSQVRMVGELAALDAWYGQIRSRLAGGDAARSELYARGREMVRMNLAERIAQLGALAARMERSAELLEAAAPGDPRIAQQRALLEHWPRIEQQLTSAAENAPEAPAALLNALEDAAGSCGGVYTRTLREISDQAVAAGREWLEGVARRVASDETLALVPALE